MSIGEGRDFEAEVRAILQALLFCKEYQVSRVLIELDSTLVVGWVTSQNNRPWKLLRVLLQIDRLMQEVE